MLYLGWVLAAFLAGVLLTAVFLLRRRRLRERMIALGVLVGKDYAAIEAAIRIAPQSTVRQTNGQILRAWEEGTYFVSLLFDKNDVCLGVMEERECEELSTHR